MNIQRTLLALLAITMCLFTAGANAAAQSTETYQQMTQPQRAAFVAEQETELLHFGLPDLRGLETRPAYAAEAAE